MILNKSGHMGCGINNAENLPHGCTIPKLVIIFRVIRKNEDYAGERREK